MKNIRKKGDRVSGVQDEWKVGERNGVTTSAGELCAYFTPT